MNLTEYLKVRLDETDYNGLKALAADEETTVSVLIRQRVREMLCQSPVSEWEDQ